MRIAIHSVPRSGSSWLGQIFNSSPDVNFKFQPLFSYAFKSYLNESSSQEDVNTFFDLISKSKDAFLLQQDKIDQGIYPVFQKERQCAHVVYKEVRYHNILKNMLNVAPDVIVVGIVRNPYAVINSFLNAAREFRKDLGWSELTEWKYARKKNLDRSEEYFGYEKWKEVKLLFYKLKQQHPRRFYLVEYDKLIANSFDEVENLFNFCGIEVTEQTKEFLRQNQKLNTSDTYSVYNSKTTDNEWQESLNPLIVESISKDLRENGLDT